MLLVLEQTLSLCFRVFATELIAWCQHAQNVMVFITVVSKGVEKPEDKKVRKEKYIMTQECVCSGIFTFSVSDSTSDSTVKIKT